MRFFKIRLRVREFFEEKIYNPQEIVGAEDEETALALCKQDWENSGYTYVETISCEEIYPEAVFCNQVVKQGEVEKWLRR